MCTLEVLADGWLFTGTDQFPSDWRSAIFPGGAGANFLGGCISGLPRTWTLSSSATIVGYAPPPENPPLFAQLHISSDADCMGGAQLCLLG